MASFLPSVFVLSFIVVRQRPKDLRVIEDLFPKGCYVDTLTRICLPDVPRVVSIYHYTAISCRGTEMSTKKVVVVKRESAENVNPLEKGCEEVISIAAPFSKLPGKIVDFQFPT